MIPDKYQIGELAPKPPALRSEEEVMSSWKATTTPVISILCLTYNQKDYLEDALRGFLGQLTQFPFEIIIHDDASSDGTVDILKSYAYRYPHIIRPIFSSVNLFSQGFSLYPRTLCLAHGEFIAICDGDDYWLDVNKLEQQANFLLKNKEYSICYHDSINISKNGIITKSFITPITSQKDSSQEELKGGELYIATNTVMIRNIFQPMPFEANKVLNEDSFLFSIIGRYGKGHFMGNIEKSVYRIHDKGVFSIQQDKFKTICSLTTTAWLSNYYSKIPGEDEIAKKFMLKLPVHIIFLEGVGLRTWFKLTFIKMYMLYYKKFKKSIDRFFQK